MVTERQLKIAIQTVDFYNEKSPRRTVEIVICPMICQINYISIRKVINRDTLYSLINET